MGKKYRKQTIEHQREKYGKFTRCEQHNREMTLFCKEDACNVLICPRCQRIEHLLHTVVEIEDREEEYRKALNGTLKFIKTRLEALEKCGASIIESHDLTMDKVQATHAKINLLIKKHQDAHIETLMLQKYDNLKKLEDTKDELKRELQKLEDDEVKLDTRTEWSPNLEYFENIQEIVNIALLNVTELKGTTYIKNEKEDMRDCIEKTHKQLIGAELSIDFAFRDTLALPTAGTSGTADKQSNQNLIE